MRHASLVCLFLKNFYLAEDQGHLDMTTERREVATVAVTCSETGILMLFDQTVTLAHSVFVYLGVQESFFWTG